MLLESCKLTLIRLMGWYTRPEKFGRPGASHKDATGIQIFNISTKKVGTNRVAGKLQNSGHEKRKFVSATSYTVRKAAEDRHLTCFIDRKTLSFRRQA